MQDVSLLLALLLFALHFSYSSVLALVQPVLC
jgi:hypothetical protein